MLHNALWKLSLKRSGIPETWRELDSFQQQSPTQAKKELSRRLLSQIQYFGKRADALPEWRELANIRNEEDLWSHWTSLPILSKQDLRTHFRPHEMQQRFQLEGRTSSTGGSTGEPTAYFHDVSMMRATSAAKLYCWRGMGWTPGMPIICLWGSERDIGKHRKLSQRVRSRLQNLWLVDGYSLDSQTVDRVISIIRAHSSVAIYGFTSILEFVAREILERNIVVRRGEVHTAWNGGEMLFDTQSALFQEAFGVPILNFYGGREMSAMAYQSAANGSMHVLRPLMFLEIVDQEGRPVSPGVPGRLIWTSTICRGTPFLRYDIGDMGCYNEIDCDESGIRAISELQGRQSGLLRLPNGKTISCLFWNHFFKDFPEVIQFQVVLQKNSQILLRLKGKAFTSERERELREILRNTVEQIPISISWVEHIPLTEQGKLVQVIQE